VNTAPLILIAEDDPLSLKLMRDVLGANGYRTLEAMAGPEAIELATGCHPDAVIMDIGLPGLDGVEATRQIKAKCAVPVIAVTAYAMPGDEERMRLAGSDAYLTKPLRFSEFLIVLQRLLSSELRGQSSDSGSEK
jgi:two-component system cell cycle response regulator DivK